MPKTSEFKIQILISNTYERIPCTQVYLPLDHPMPFFKATEISAPKISFEVEVSREEVSIDLVGTVFKIAKKIVEFTDAQVSDEELKVEIEKIANLKLTHLHLNGAKTVHGFTYCTGINQQKPVDFSFKNRLSSS